MLQNLMLKNKNAAKHTGRIAVGKTATDLLMDKVVKRLPFFARFFKGKKVKNNELARLAVAEAALAAQMQFAPDNEKLATVAEAMVEEAMASVVIDSKIFKDIQKELENLV